MCLGVPGRVLDVDGEFAMVDFWGVRKQVRLDIIDQPVAAGDYVLSHVGFAIRRIPADEIGETLALYETLLQRAEAEDLPDSEPNAIAAAAAPSSTRAAFRGDDDA